MELVSDELTRRFDLNELDIRKNFKQVSSSTGRIPDKNLSSALIFRIHLHAHRNRIDIDFNFAECSSFIIT